MIQSLEPSDEAESGTEYGRSAGDVFRAQARRSRANVAAASECVETCLSAREQYSQGPS